MHNNTPTDDLTITHAELMDGVDKLTQNTAQASPQLRAPLQLFTNKLRGLKPASTRLDVEAANRMVTYTRAFAEKQQGAAEEALETIANALEETISQRFEVNTLDALPAMPKPVSEVVFAKTRQRTGRQAFRAEVMAMGTAIPPLDGITQSALEAIYSPQMSGHIGQLYKAGLKQAGIGHMETFEHDGMDVAMGYFRNSHRNNPVLLMDKACFDSTVKPYLDAKQAVLRLKKEEVAKGGKSRELKKQYDADICQPFGHACARPTTKGGKRLRDAIEAALEKAKSQQSPDANGLYTVMVADEPIRAGHNADKKGILLIAHDSADNVKHALTHFDKVSQQETDRYGWRAQIKQGRQQTKSGPRPDYTGSAILESRWGTSNNGGRDR